MKHRTLRCAAETLVLLLIAAMAVFLAAGLHQRAPDGALSTLSTGWYQLTDGVRREVTLPAALETGPGQTITLYNDTLTDSDGGKVLSARGVEYGIEIRAGETLLYRYEDNAFPKNAQMKGRLWAVSELSSAAGRKWRTAYSDPANTEKVGLDDTVWPAAFENLERFIRDTGLNAADLTLNYDDIMDRMRGGELAMYFGSSMGVKRLADEGIDAAFLPFFGQDGQKWLMTTPYFQVALSRNLEQDSTRRAKAMQVLHVMLSEDAQNRIVYEGQDLLSYSQNVSLRLTDYLEDVRPVVEQNHMYIRIASNDFFSISKDVVSRMIAGEYTAKQAYQAFNAQLLADDTDTAETVLTSDKGYSNVFHADGGNASFSVMANTLRGVYDSDVLIAAANSFTGSVLAADYTEKQAASMIMPNDLRAYRRTMTGAELTETVRAFVEGSEDGFTPFNRGSLPAVSGIAIEVKEENGGFALTGVTRDGKPLQSDETVTVTCLATAKQMAPLLADDSRPFEGGDAKVRDEWSAYAAGGSAALAEPEHYITLR